jgi:ubiquitin carboxyl-terminal hydrolase L3
MSQQPYINAVVPLESNPEVFTHFAEKLGLSPLLSFQDIYSLDDPDLLAFLPRPMQAIVLLFPISEEYEKFKDSEPVEPVNNANIVWLKQLVKNACGLYALLHALLNMPSVFVVKDSPISNFRRNLIQHNADPVQLVQNIAKEMYSTYSEQGQTEAPPAEDDVELHFVCFVKLNNKIYELDGRREGPIILEIAGDAATDILNYDCVAKRVKKYMSLVSGENALKFAMMGLAPSQE